MKKNVLIMRHRYQIAFTLVPDRQCPHRARKKRIPRRRKFPKFIYDWMYVSLIYVYWHVVSNLAYTTPARLDYWRRYVIVHNPARRITRLINIQPITRVPRWLFGFDSFRSRRKMRQWVIRHLTSYCGVISMHVFPARHCLLRGAIRVVL